MVKELEKAKQQNIFLKNNNNRLSNLVSDQDKEEKKNETNKAKEEDLQARIKKSRVR